MERIRHRYVQKTSMLGQSIGNSTTTPRDLVSDEDVSIIVYLLSEECVS
jgi:hypothetical protein